VTPCGSRGRRSNTEYGRVDTTRDYRYTKVTIQSRPQHVTLVVVVDEQLLDVDGAMLYHSHRRIVVVLICIISRVVEAGRRVQKLCI
jgi:hypothetical protein